MGGIVISSLVICEKPSVARSVAAVLGAKSNKNGAYEGNGYIVSWCYGHLLSLAEPYEYDEKYAEWRYEDLPIIPSEWKYTVQNVAQQGMNTEKELYTRILNESINCGCYLFIKVASVP